MKRPVFELSFVILAGALVAGCASKGYVRGELDALRSEMETRDSEMSASVDVVQNSAADARARAEAAAGSAGEARDLALGRVGYEIVDTYVVQFAFGTEELSTEAQAALDEAAERIRSHSEYIVDIYGFTDRSGSSSGNLLLGQRRAETVLRYLASREPGSLTRFAAVSFGEDRPAASAAESRRVEVNLIVRTSPPQKEMSELN